MIIILVLFLLQNAYLASRAGQAVGVNSVGRNVVGRGCTAFTRRCGYLHNRAHNGTCGKYMKAKLEILYALQSVCYYAQLHVCQI